MLGDRRNLAFAGTLVTCGQAEGVIVAEHTVGLLLTLNRKVRRAQS